MRWSYRSTATVPTLSSLSPDFLCPLCLLQTGHESCKCHLLHQKPPHLIISLSFLLFPHLKLPKYQTKKKTQDSIYPNLIQSQDNRMKNLSLYIYSLAERNFAKFSPGTKRGMKAKNLPHPFAMCAFTRGKLLRAQWQVKDELLQSLTSRETTTRSSARACQIHIQRTNISTSLCADMIQAFQHLYQLHVHTLFLFPSSHPLHSLFIKKELSITCLM